MKAGEPMTQLIVLRSAEAHDLDWVHALNTTHQDLLSPMGFGAMAGHVDRAAYARIVEPDAAFLIALDQDAVYDSPNFGWFKAQFDRFLYVDRIAVDQRHQRRGLARHLYDDLIRFARQDGYPMVGAEINADPPNQPSIDFHAKMGFLTLGEEVPKGRDKLVRYMGLDIDPG